MKILNYSLVFYFLNVCFLFGQESPVRSAILTLQDYSIANPVEKIYLHLDKPYYAAGESMYFRAYLTDMDINQENVTSRIIYVELSDAEMKLVRRTLLYSEENEYAGQMHLPDSLPSANYQLRAYTCWMRNAGEDFFFHRDIYIGNIAIPKQEIAMQPFDYQVTFFPEGGHLLAGLPNKVAFKALGNDGFGTDITGVLSDMEGNELLQLNSKHRGMGSFIFSPEKGKTYKASVESNGLQKEFTLPAATEGYTLSTQQTAGYVNLTIRTTNVEPEMIYLIGQSRHTTCYALEGMMDGPFMQFRADKNQFPTGIAQFTLFKGGQPVSERLVFIDHKDELKVEITPDKANYEDRSLAIVQIQVTDKNGQPVVGSFSLSVTDDKIVAPSITEHNIKGSLLLDSDLKGYIESPGWYFAGNEPERAEALDYLLCTQGWSRFEWDKVAERKEITYPAEDSFRFSGTVTNQTGKPVANASIYMTSNENMPGTIVADENGRFAFSGFDCPEGAVFSLQSLDQQIRRTTINFEMDEPDNRHIQTKALPRSRTDNSRATLIKTYTEQASRQLMHEAEIRTIKLPESAKEEARRVPARQAIYTSSQRFGGRTLEQSLPIINVFRTLPLLDRRNTSSSVNQAANKVPIIYDVDGVRMHKDDFEAVYGQVTANMFESIDIISPEDALQIYGMVAANGAYAFKTKRFTGNTEVFVSSADYIYRPEGYSVMKEFYVPAYNVPEVKQNPAPDLRTTVYWNPAIRTDRTGKAEIRFYTADNVTSCSYILEGIGDNKIGFVK